MRSWDLDSFEHNNRKLNHYLSNIDNAIVLLCANDRQAMIKLQEMLQNRFAFEGINYDEIQQPFPELLKGYQKKREQNKLCFYHLPEENDGHDLIKTVNVSRDLLRKVGVVVFIVHSFIMEKIQLENPNLYDYITLCLDYNIEYRNHLEPIYSEEGRYFLPKKVRTSRKAAVLANQPREIQTVGDYYHYLEVCQYMHVTQEDVHFMIDWLFDYLHESLAVRNLGLENILDQISEDSSEFCVDLYRKTAIVFLQHGYYHEALVLFDEVLYVNQGKRKPFLSDKTSIAEFETIQGKAYCYYRMGDYQQAQDTLMILQERIKVVNNPVWSYKALNDIGVCSLKQNRVQEAIAIWKECEAGLREIGEYNTHRHFRILYNTVLASLEGEYIFSKYGEEWDALGKEISHNIGKDGWEYFMYLLMSSWMYFKGGRLGLAWDFAMQAYKVGDLILPDYDEKRIWCNYILALVAQQQGEIKNHRYFLTRCRNILKNHPEQIPDYQDLY